MKDFDVAIILPTRGLVYTQVEDAIHREIDGTWHKVKYFRSYDKTIPEAQNFLVEEALKHEGINWFWFIEEDVVVPEGSFKRLFNQTEPISFIDYGVNGWSCSAKNEDGEIVWCGFGCTMVRREVFEKLNRPYFRTDKALRLNDGAWIDTNPDKVYGQQDIWFCVKAREAGFKIKQVEGECKHLKLDQLGQPEVNKGLHTISEKPRINKYQSV